MLAEPQLCEKFIAFIDILGFESKVEAVEKREGLRLSDLLEYCSKLSQESHTRSIAEYGPVICPESRYTSRDLDYQVTQVSDCAVISAEISPAGVINLLQHVSACVLGLMTKGIMVRGYISRGNVFHKDNQFIGTGYQDALRKEKRVRAFRFPADKTSTPFVEIDPVVVSYVKEETDRCVREIFERLAKEDDNGITAIFPFDRLSDLAGQNIMDAEKCRRSLDVVRRWISDFMERLDSQAPPSNTEADQKSAYYRSFLKGQLDECDRIEETLDLLKSRP